MDFLQNIMTRTPPESSVSLHYLSFCLQPLDRLCEFRLFCRQQLHVLIHLLHDWQFSTSQLRLKLLICGKCCYEVRLIRSQTAFFRPTFVSWPSLSTICCNLPWPCTSSSPSWKFHDDYTSNDSIVKISSAGIFSIAPFLLKRTLSWNVNCHFMQYQ